MEVRSSVRVRTLVAQMARSSSVRYSERTRADIHDGPEHNTLQSEAGYIDARPPPPIRRNLLATHGRTIHWVKLRRTQCEHMFSALPRTRTLFDAIGMSQTCHTRTWGQAHKGKLALPHRAD